MEIITGLFDHMVLQRAAGGRSDAAITGTTAAIGPVRARVTLKNRPLPGFAGKAIGTAARGKFTARLAGLPAGGPYTIELSAGDEKLMARDVLVGDVWISAGQSNMHGVGLLSQAASSQPLCRAFYMDDRWAVAHDPINETEIAVDQVHADLRGGPAGPRNTVVGTGPAVAFIQEMERITGVPQGVIACAHGGTSMAQWDPAKKTLGSKSLYGATLRRFEKNGGRVAGIIWYQGESETTSPETAADYRRTMPALVGAFRRDLRSPKLPVAMVQIARVVGWPDFGGWNAVQEAQRLFPETVGQLTTVPAIDLGLDDGIHICGAAQQRLGKRLAGAMLALLKHRKAGPPPITLKAVRMRKVPGREVVDILVEFDHVVGALSGVGRPSGFVMLDEKNLNYVFDVRVEKNCAILRTDRTPQQAAGMRIHYGYGNDPFCTITDAADRSLPAFGPIVVK